MYTKLTTNPNRIDLDEAYLQMAEVWAHRSKANRLQVGALIVKDKQIISDGYNGMPSGAADDVCEYYTMPEGYDGQDGIGGPPSKVLRTKPDVLHAESNALLKITENGGIGAQGGTLYVTDSPCPECAKLIVQAKITRVVYRREYRIKDGIELLRKYGVKVDHIPEKK
jgi:dCMP deaminase